MSKTRIEAWLNAELVDRMDVARAEISASRTTFIAMALSAYLRRWKSPVSGKAPVATWASGWPKNAKCYHCKKLGHDPELEHGYGPGETEWAQVEQLTVPVA